MLISLSCCCFLIVIPGKVMPCPSGVDYTSIYYLHMPPPSINKTGEQILADHPHPLGTLCLLKEMSDFKKHYDVHFKTLSILYLLSGCRCSFSADNPVASLQPCIQLFHFILKALLSSIIFLLKLRSLFCVMSFSLFCLYHNY